MLNLRLLEDYFNIMTPFSAWAAALLAIVASLVDAAPPACRAVNQHQVAQQQVGKAIYFLTNEAENAVVALPIGSDGLLSAGQVVMTGGAGGFAVNASGQPQLPDGLNSQSSITLVDNVSELHLLSDEVLMCTQTIFAVNAGSNTLTMLSVSPLDPTRMTLVGQPVPFPGEFPISVAASLKNKLVCVTTTGQVAGVSCASWSAQGLEPMGGLRPFQLNQTTPPMGPLNTVSQTLFSKDETKLYTMVKGNPMVNNTGYMASVDIVQDDSGIASLAQDEVRSSPNGTAVLFGTTKMLGDSTSLFTTDASFGAVILSVDSTGRATTDYKQVIPGQVATCWSTISTFTKSAYVTDVGVNRVVEMSLTDASIIKELDLTNGDPGLIDLQSAGTFVYALAPGNGTTPAAITVLDVSGGQGSMKQAQHFSLQGVADKHAQGMAVMM